MNGGDGGGAGPRLRLRTSPSPCWTTFYVAAAVQSPLALTGAASVAGPALAVAQSRSKRFGGFVRCLVQPLKLEPVPFSGGAFPSAQRRQAFAMLISVLLLPLSAALTTPPPRSQRACRVALASARLSLVSGSAAVALGAVCSA